MIGKNIKRIRINKKLGLNKTARKAGISGSYLSDIENGKKENPTVTTLEKIADALEVPLDYLTRKSVKAMIEDRLEELNMTLDDLSNKTKIPVSYFEQLDSIIPDEHDYHQVQKIANALDIEPTVLLNSLSRQEPPTYDGPVSTAEEDFEFNYVYSDKKQINSKNQFKSPEEAMKFILEQPSIMGFGGFDINKMSDEEIVEFANELLRQLKLISYKYKK